MLLVLQIAQYEAVALEVKTLLLVLFWTVFRIMHQGIYLIIFMQKLKKNKFWPVQLLKNNPICII